MGTARGTLRIGTSGYQYNHWRGVFYPPDIPKKHWFVHYASRFDTVEINNTFYRITVHPRQLTADWVYLRFHGVGYGGSYSRQELTAQARYIEQYLAAGLDVFAYFNNDAHGYAVQTATDLRRYVRGN
jgi:uncharacterized protein YecE (DUF72 family)